MFIQHNHLRASQYAFRWITAVGEFSPGILLKFSISPLDKELHLVRGWMEPKAGLDAVEESKISVFARN
jgi:hypothetical protein